MEVQCLRCHARWTVLAYGKYVCYCGNKITLRAQQSGRGRPIKPVSGARLLTEPLETELLEMEEVS